MTDILNQLDKIRTKLKVIQMKNRFSTDDYNTTKANNIFNNLNKIRIQLEEREGDTPKDENILIDLKKVMTHLEDGQLEDGLLKDWPILEKMLAEEEKLRFAYMNQMKNEEILIELEKIHTTIEQGTYNLSLSYGTRTQLQEQEAKLKFAHYKHLGAKEATYSVIDVRGILPISFENYRDYGEIIENVFARSWDSILKVTDLGFLPIGVLSREQFQSDDLIKIHFQNLLLEFFHELQNLKDNQNLIGFMATSLDDLKYIRHPELSFKDFPELHDLFKSKGISFNHSLKLFETPDPINAIPVCPICNLKGELKLAIGDYYVDECPNHGLYYCEHKKITLEKEYYWIYDDIPTFRVLL